LVWMLFIASFDLTVRCGFVWVVLANGGGGNSSSWLRKSKVTLRWRQSGASETAKRKRRWRKTGRMAVIGESPAGGECVTVDDMDVFG